MDQPYKIEVTMSYTETVYYTASGQEVSRQRHFDDWTFDESEPIEISDEELEDYFDEDDQR